LLEAADSRAADPPPHSQLVIIAGKNDDSRRYQVALDAIRAQLGDAGIRVEASRSESLASLSQEVASHARGEFLGALWMDFGPAGDVLFVAVNPSGAPVLVRQIHGETERIAFEELGLVVRSTVLGLADASAAGSPPAPAVAERDVPAPGPGPSPGAPTGNRRTQVRVSVRYAATSFAPEAPWRSSAMIAAQVEAPFGGLAGAGYEFAEPIAAADEGVSLRLSSRPVTAFVGYALGGESIRVEGDLAVSASWTTRTSTASSGYDRTPDASRWIWSLSPRAHVRWEPGLIGYFAGLGVDFVLNRLAYTIPPRVLLAPYAVEPRLEAGIAVRLW
jgi:hypothetical protein